MPPRSRLSAYDYTSPGWYFVTTVSAGRRPLFGTVTESGVELSLMGCLVRDEWEATLNVRRWVSCAASVVMPDHFHALVGWDRVPEHRDASLSALMSSFKGHSTKRLRGSWLLRSCDVVWMRGYWDQVIRGQRHYDRVLQYILNNPAKAWHRSQVRAVPCEARRERGSR